MSPSFTLPSLCRKTFALYLLIKIPLHLCGKYLYHATISSLWQSLKNTLYIDKNGPNFILLHKNPPILILSDLLKQIAIIGILHNNTSNKTFYHNLLLASHKKTSLYKTTCGDLMLARILTSLNAFCFSFSDSSFSLTCLSAYSWLSAIRFTRNTLL